MIGFCPVLLLAATLWAGDVSGKWTGSAAMPEGPQSVYAVFKQNGSEVTGTIGTSEDRQAPIEAGKLEGDKLTFQVMGPAGRPFKLAFTLAGNDRLEGQAEGEMSEGNKISAKVTLSRSSGGSVTGKWSGTAELKFPDGRTENSGAYAVLKQSGQDVTGTAGPREDEQHPIEKGRFEGNKLTFQVTPPDGEPVYKLSFVLVSDDKLEGEVLAESGERKLTGKLTLTRQR